MDLQSIDFFFFFFRTQFGWGLPGGAVWYKSHVPMQETKETQVQSLGRADPLGKEMATHSSVLAWKIPWTEEPGGPQCMGSQSQTQLSDCG